MRWLLMAAALAVCPLPAMAQAYDQDLQAKKDRYALESEADAYVIHIAETVMNCGYKDQAWALTIAQFVDNKEKEKAAAWFGGGGDVYSDFQDKTGYPFFRVDRAECGAISADPSIMVGLNKVYQQAVDSHWVLR